MARIEIGVTHQITINGDNAWVKLSITDDYEITGPSDLDLFVNDLSKKVNDQIIRVIEQTVETVDNYTKG
jgi:hypothetical protein